MPSLSLIPLVNRFSPQVIDVNSDGVIAFGSRTNIVLLNVKSDVPQVQDIIRAAHSSSKVTSVSFCKNKNPELLASTGEDSVVKIWDVSYSPVCIHQVEASELCFVVEWKYQDNMIFFPGDGGSVVKWNFKINSTKKVKMFSQNHIHILASNPINPNLLAIGHRGGTISILNVVNENLCHKLRAHTLDIICLSWSPINEDMLISVSKDYTTRVWMLGEPSPKFTYDGTPHRTEEFKFKVWICAKFHPSNPDYIICTTCRGEIGQVSIRGEEKARFDTFSNKEFGGHFKHLLNLILFNNPYDGRTLLCSYGADNQMVFWDISLKKSICAMPTIGGFIHDLSFSPIDANRLAIASADGSVRVWNVSCPTNKVSVKTLWQVTRGRIMVVAWHPTKENLLAFGTDVGRVGVVDVLTNKRLNTNSIFESQHRGSVYSLSWGPCAKANKNSDSRKFFLYSCGGGEVYVHNPNAVKSIALNFCDLIERDADSDASQQKILAEVSWKLDYSCVAIGKNDGYIDLYSAETFTLISRLFAQRKQIQCLVWHPMFTSLSQEQSALHAWLACSSNENFIQVYDLSTVINTPSEDIIYNSTKQLSGHTKRVVSLSWSPHIEGQLASASYDGTVQVWNVLTGQPIVNFRNHMESALAVQWSILDPDIIYSGGEDCSVVSWKISEQSEVTPPVKCAVKRQVTKKKPQVAKPPQVTEHITEEASIKDDSQVSSEDKQKFQNGEIEPVEENAIPKVDLMSLSQDKIDEGDEKERSRKHERGMRSIYNPKKGLFPEFSCNANSSKEKNLETCRKLVDIVIGSSEENDERAEIPSNVYKTGAVKEDINFGFFTDQCAAIELLDVEANNHRARGTQDCAFHLEMWKGNIKGALNEAADRGELNEFLLSLAPIASRSLWLEMCEKYAMQLLSRKFFQKASQYLLACNKLYEAIEVVAEQGHIRDALALAKARLPESDPVITQLLQKWSTKLISEQKFILAAECFIALKQPLEAAKALCRAPDFHSSEIAAYVCLKFDLKEAEEFSLLCLKRCLLQKEWQHAKSLQNHLPSMKIYAMLFAVHESLSSHYDLFKSGNSEYGIMAEVFPRNPNNDVILWKGFTIGGNSYLGHLYLSLKSQNFALSNKSDLVLQLKTIHKVLDVQHNPQSEDEALFLTALLNTECLINIILKNRDSAIENLLNILHICLPFENLFNASLQLFFPADFAWSSKLESLSLINIDSQIMDDDTTFKSLSQFEKMFLNQSIFKTEMYEKEVFESSSDKLISHMPNPCLSNICDMIKFLSDANYTDFLLAYFTTNVVRQLRKLVVDNNLKLPCVGVLLNDTDVNSTSNHDASRDSTSDGNECHYSTPNGTEDVDSVDDLIHSVLKEADEKIKELSKTKNSEMDKTNLSDLAFEHVIKSVNCDICQNLSAQESAGISVVGEIITESLLLEQEPAKPRDQPHSKCLKITKVFHKLLKFLTSYICRDMFAIKYFLLDLLRELKSSIALAVANQRSNKSQPIKEHVIKSPKHVLSSTDTKLGTDSINTSEKTVIVSTDKPESENVIARSDEPETNEIASISTEDIKTSENNNVDISVISKVPSTHMEEECSTGNYDINDQDQVQKLQDQYQKIYKLISDAEEMSLNLKYPNPFNAASDIVLLCSEVVNRSACEAVKELLHEYIHSIVKWGEKFSRENRCYIKCAVCTRT